MFKYEKPYGTYYNATIERQAKPLSRKSKIVTIAGIVVGVIAILIALSAVLNRPGSEVDVNRLGASMTILVDITAGARKDVRDYQLNQINTNARLLFTTDKNAISGVLKSEYGLTGITGDAVARQRDATVKERLDEAKLINQYDIQYRAIMQEKIGIAILAAQKAQRASKNSAVRDAVNTTLSNLKTVQQQLDETEL